MKILAPLPLCPISPLNHLGFTMKPLMVQGRTPRKRAMTGPRTFLLPSPHDSAPNLLGTADKQCNLLPLRSLLNELQWTIIIIT